LLFLLFHRAEHQLRHSDRFKNARLILNEGAFSHSYQAWDSDNVNERNESAQKSLHEAVG